MRRKERKTLDHEMGEVAKLFRRLNNKVVGVQMEMERLEREGKVRNPGLEDIIAKMDMVMFLETMSRFWKYLHPTVFDQMLLEGLKREAEERR